ncbi:alpha-hydroxy-acid oxidizing protein [Micrococcales bacterium 31B]|nr:alpha-hydroxy-acid oxidizing protein [Micrococcales bacterium 31B]
MLAGRQVPRWHEIRPLLNPQFPPLNPTRRRLQRAHSIADLRRIARGRVPRAVFDYVDGGAEREVSLRRARRQFDRVEFQPRVLRDVARVDLSRELLGERHALPLALAPTGFTRMMHHAGETVVARAAARAGVPYTLSTMGTTTPEEVAAVDPAGRRWFQLYLWRDRDASRSLVRRAREAGYDTLMLTVDTPVGGARLRDARNGLTIPPTLGLRTLADMSLHPAWWLNVLTTRPIEFASLTHWDGTVSELVGHVFDPSAVLADLEWLRAEWPGHLVVKGIQHVADARIVVDAGADAVVVSNHGGRQLDRAPTPLSLLPDVVDAVGSRAEVYLDSGVLTGADVVAAVALGARGVLIGRAYLYGLMAGGEAGVQAALGILEAEVRRTLQLLGVSRMDDLSGEHVRLRGA